MLTTNLGCTYTRPGVTRPINIFYLNFTCVSLVRSWEDVSDQIISMFSVISATFSFGNFLCQAIRLFNVIESQT